MLTEFSGIAGVGRLFGVSPWMSISLTVIFLVAVVATGTYRQVEKIALLIGLFELAFVAVAIVSHPSRRSSKKPRSGGQAPRVRRILRSFAQFLRKGENVFRHVIRLGNPGNRQEGITLPPYKGSLETGALGANGVPKVRCRHAAISSRHFISFTAV